MSFRNNNKVSSQPDIGSSHHLLCFLFLNLNVQFVFLSPKNETLTKKQKDTCKENPNEGGVTLPKANVTPENRPYQKEIDLPSPIFAGGCVFQGVSVRVYQEQSEITIQIPRTYFMGKMVVPLGWYPSCLTLPQGTPLKGVMYPTNNYPLYKVYMGLVIKGPAHPKGTTVFPMTVD